MAKPQRRVPRQQVGDAATEKSDGDEAIQARVEGVGCA